MKTKKKSGKTHRKSGKSQGKIREFDGIKKVGTLSSLHEVRFKTYKVGLSPQSVCSLLDFLFILTLLTRTIKPKFYTIERIFFKNYELIKAHGSQKG